MSGIEELQHMSAYELAREAETSAPDNQTSAGALWLRGVRDAVVDGITTEYIVPGEDEYERFVNETADSVIPRGTYDMWSVFVDLELYQHETDFSIGGTMTDKAMSVMYDVAQRFIERLFDLASE